MIHSLAWLTWILGALIALSATRNPFYLAPMLLCILIVSDTVTSRATHPRALPISPIQLLIVVTLLGGVLNALMVRTGDTILLRLPAWLPLIGNATLTGEAFVYGALNGLAISGFFAAFGILNVAVPVRTLVQRIPRAFYPLAVVTSISVTFVPFTLRQLAQIREAQAVRGHEMHGPRDWLPLFMPLLVGGLERALQLAEAMVSRGFASTESAEDQTRDSRTQVATILALLAVLSGWLLELVWGQALIGGGLIVLGVAVLGLTLRAIGRRTTHTVYRHERWHASDWIVIGAAILVTGVFSAPWPISFRASLFYYPYPVLTLPGINPWLFCATLGLLAPIVILALDQKRKPS
jgi:energy-coupling factor transport system permease protein